MVPTLSNNRQIRSNVVERFRLLVVFRSLSSVGLSGSCFETVRTIVHSLRKLHYQSMSWFLSAE